MKNFILLLIIPLLSFGQSWKKEDVHKFIKECKTDLASVYVAHGEREEKCNCLLKSYENKFQSPDELEKLFEDYNVALEEGRKKDAKIIEETLELFIKEALGNCEVKYILE